MHMKRIMIWLVLACVIAGATLAEGGFSFREGVAWGMTPDQVLAAEGNPRAEADREAGFDILEIEDAALYGGTCDLKYFFKRDALLAAACEYEDADPAAAFARLSKALTAEFGAPLDPDTERWLLLEDILDGEMASRAMDAFASWQTEDGSFVALVEDAADGSVGLYFYNETAVVETAL